MSICWCVTDPHKRVAGSSLPESHRCSGWLWAQTWSPSGIYTQPWSPVLSRRTGPRRASRAAAARSSVLERINSRGITSAWPHHDTSSQAAGLKGTHSGHANGNRGAFAHRDSCFSPAKITPQHAASGLALHSLCRRSISVYVGGLRCSNTAKIIFSISTLSSSGYPLLVPIYLRQSS